MTKSKRLPQTPFAKTAGPGLAGVWLLAVVAAMLVGCFGKGKTNAPAATPAVAGTASQEHRYRVSKDVTPFYRFGPQQPNGPDLSLKKGTDLLVVKRAFGYSQVKTLDTQQTGYVATEDIAPLTQQELAALAAAAAGPPPVQSVAGPGKKSRAIVGEYTLPAGAGTEDHLPQSESTPTPPPNNMFR